MYQVERVRQRTDKLCRGPVERTEEEPTRPSYGSHEYGCQSNALQSIPKRLAEDARSHDKCHEQQAHPGGNETVTVYRAIRCRAIEIHYWVVPNRQSAPEQDRVESRIGAEIRTVDTSAPRENERASPYEDERACSPETHGLLSAAEMKSAHKKEYGRKDDVEVLLDGQRPIDPRAARNSFPPVLGNPVVGNVKRLRRHRHPLRCRFAAKKSDLAEQRPQGEHDVKWGKYSQCASQIEMLYVQVPGAAHLHSHERRYQISTQEKEYRDPESPGDDPVEPRVRQKYH